MNEYEEAIRYFERMLENSKRMNETGAMQYMYDEQIRMLKIALRALRENPGDFYCSICGAKMDGR